MNGAHLKDKTAHYISGTTRDLCPLIPQVMNGTGPLRQFVVKAARHSSRAAFEYLVAVLRTRRLEHIVETPVEAQLAFSIDPRWLCWFSV
jgi:hypothetical protein